MNTLRIAVSVAAATVVAVAVRILASPRRRRFVVCVRRQDEGNGDSCVDSIDRRVLNRIVAMLPDEVAIAFHAERRKATRDHYGGIQIHCVTFRLGYQARLLWWRKLNMHYCVWNSANGCDSCKFDRKGRLTETGHRGNFPGESRHCRRFALQRMCRRLVQRTRLRIQCRRHLEPYLIPDLVNIVTAYC